MIHVSALMSRCEETHKKAARQRCRGGRNDEIIKSNDEVSESTKEQDRSSRGGRKKKQSGR